jgi:hypothetical protein
MKKVIILTSCLLLMAVSLNAQSFKRFFGSIDQVVAAQQEVMARAKDTQADIEKVFLPRLSLSVTGFGLSFGGGKPTTQSFNSAGLGISYGEYTTVNGEAYCNYSFNIALLLAVEITGSTDVHAGVIGTVDVFNKFVGIGIGYLNKHPMLITSFSYSF